MQTKGNDNLHNIADVVALRVILEKESDSSSSEPPEDRAIWLCYHVLGLVQNLPGCQPVPTRVKDYISFPKPNGYQSLHTAIMFHGSQMIEVQIRTAAMHRVVPQIEAQLEPQDLVLLSADHGCDPTWPGSDHTREHVPVVFYGHHCGLPVQAIDLGERTTFADMGQTVASHLGLVSLNYGIGCQLN